MTESFDVVIVGGAVHGASAAYHLAADPGFGGSILLLERDTSFRTAATALSLSSIRQQFSSPINVLISLAGIAFLRRIGEALEVEGERPDISLREGGYLFLATPPGAAQLAENHALQVSLGADIVHLDPAGLAANFPWLSTEGLAAGCWGRTGEGWFDGFGLMQAFRRKAKSLGAVLRQGEAAAVETEGGRATGIRLADGTHIAAGAVLLCAGTGNPALARSAGFSLPVEARKRLVFTFACREQLPRFPLLIDPTGVFARPEGELYLSGASPPEADDPEATDFEVDHRFFEDVVWPALAARVPAFEAIRPGRAWAGHYDYNHFDQNALVGAVPGVERLFLASGFSGHGIQQSPAVGRGLAELIAHGGYRGLDLSPLSPERLLSGERLLEKNVV